MNAQCAALTDFFDFHKDDDLAMSIAKVVTKNILQPQNAEEAMSIVLQHSPSVSSVMNRKIITKALIFRYLNARNVSVTVDTSKVSLLEKLYEFWNYKFSDQFSEQTKCIDNDQTANGECTQHVQTGNEDQFPIHRMSREFSNWFFKGCNESQLKIADFWRDAEYSVEMIASGQLVRQDEGNGSESLLELLQSLHTQNHFWFHPNDCHDGIQGRMDAYGLVVVFCCGTLHSQGAFVGVFESMFGLARDPCADGNWKIKRLQMRLKSSSQRDAPRLAECSYLGTMLALPPPTNTDL